MSSTGPAPDPAPPAARDAVGAGSLGGRLWGVRDRLGPQARRRARRLVDLLGAGVLGSTVGARGTDAVALTLDDGPDPEVTPALLDLFAALDVRATFFLLTAQTSAHPDLAPRIAAAGHEVALHGRDHRRITTMTGRDARAYLARGRAELEQAVGEPVRWYRPPYGAQSPVSFRAARAAGLTPVLWDGDAEDWTDRPVGSVVADGVAATGPGGVLLLHERLEPDLPRAAPTTSFDRVEMVAGIVAGLRERGLDPVSVDDLLRAGRVRRSVWLRP